MEMWAQCYLEVFLGMKLPGVRHSWVRMQEEAYECSSRRLEVGVGFCSKGEVLIRTWSC